MNSYPIIFIHSGDSDYLKYVFKSALFFGNEVILIGDQSNKKYESLGVKHYLFTEFEYGVKLEQFDKIYFRVGGEKFEEINKAKGLTDWTKFNFKKWFVLHNFCLEKKLKSFWTFDSDNMILRNLDAQLDKFSDYDSTEQNMGMSMQGLINNVEMLGGFTSKIIELYKRSDYLDEQRKDFIEKPEYGFTMMRAYETFIAEENRYKTIRLNSIIKDETFLDFLFGKKKWRYFLRKFPIEKLSSFSMMLRVIYLFIPKRN